MVAYALVLVFGTVGALHEHRLHIAQCKVQQAAMDSVRIALALPDSISPHLIINACR